MSASLPARPRIAGNRRIRETGRARARAWSSVDGALLDAVIRDHAPLAVSTVRSVLVQLCNALQFAHDHGLAHGDVKPATILIDAVGNLRVMDTDDTPAADCEEDTQTGTTIGTPEYMSPEQCVGEPSSFASDQYSVGVIAYELLTGFPPFMGTPGEVLTAHLREVPVWVGFARRDCPTSLAAAVMRMLARAPNERWPALRDAVAVMAAARRAGADNGRSELAQLVRATLAAEPPLPMAPPMPLPASMQPLSQRLPPLPIPTEASFGATRSRADVVRFWVRRVATVVGLVAAVIAGVWLEVKLIAMKPNARSAPARVVTR